MDERVKKIITGIIVLVIFVICLALIIVGQKHVGTQGLLTMLLGLAGLIGLLAYYNSRYR
ncbi:DUF6903 family protein [[Clostridium] scindens]|uniref:DUF6903 family protein n=1 Tax=Clostridium scindens (strain JCM 10418 / VPI 12708) TaxID=29347 RepID=UPI00298C9152|nr:hypothetical protein [[Clostridium] scindens]WPB39480.1 hypothetical protein DEGADCKI_00785 [[Clostridium] scindens]